MSRIASRITLVLLILPGLACQRAAERQATGPMDAPINRMQAAAMQASLQALLTPRTFRAVLQADAFDRDRTGAFADLQLQGAATLDEEVGGEGVPSVLRFTLRHDAGNIRVVLDVHTVPEAPGSGLPAGTYTQQLDGSHPTVEAVVHEGRRHFNSRSGSLVLTDVDADHVKGRFYFELQSPDVGTEEDWFEIVGVFDARRAGVPES
jgi:hypothetical protein